MNNALLGLILFFSFSTQVFSQELCPVKNYIFLIHGIGGSAKTFGALGQYLNATNSCFKTLSFEYDTGNSSLSTYDFANSFHAFVKSQKEIKSHDKISLIMHSQGGIVGNLWLNKVKDINPVLYYQVDSFITLSTPYWGSELANVGQKLFYTLPPKIDNPFPPFGRTELNEMSFGSETIRDMSFEFVRSYYPTSLRPLSIGGIYQNNNKIISEGDAVVPLYSSRPDHFFGSFDINIKDFQGHISVSNYTKTKRVPFVIVPAAHLMMTIPGIANIPEDCLELRNCDHPSLSHIVNHLEGRSPASVTEPVLSKFRVNIYLNNNTDLDIEHKDVEVKVESLDEVRIPIKQKFRRYRGKAKLKEDIAFSFFGFTKEAGIQKIRLSLKFKKRIQRVVDIPVEGGHSSILNLNLKE